MAGPTKTVGVPGAITHNNIKRILAFHIVSQIGYMIMGLGLFSVAGLAGAVLYVIHHIVVKTTLFLIAGLVEFRAGTGDLDRIGGLARLEPVLAVLYLLPALSLAGLPPFSGFVAKLALIDAGLAVDQWGIVAVSLLVSLLTLFSVTKIWANVFWEVPEVQESDMAERSTLAGRTLMVGATGVLVVLSLAIAAGSGPLFELSTRAAEELVDPTPYREAVLRP